MLLSIARPTANSGKKALGAQLVGQDVYCFHSQERNSTALNRKQDVLQTWICILDQLA